MALFQRNQQSTAINKLFTIGVNKSILIIGLGNPGKEYINTRHNIGFECIDDIVEHNDFSHWQEKKSLKSLVITGNIGETRAIFVKPTTFMNESGLAVKKVADFYKISPQETIVIHDELDIPFGTIRASVGGSSAGHNGIKSMIENLGESFERIRVGIGPKTPKQIEGADFVLGKFSSEQQDQMNELKQEVRALVTERIYGGQLPVGDRRFIL